MIAAAAKHGYLDTRITLLAQRLLSNEALRRLVDTPVEQQRELLDRARLPISARSGSGTALLEPQSVGALLEEAMIILRPLRSAARGLLHHWLRRFELINLKTILRGKIAGWSPEAVQGALVDLGGFGVLPVDELSRTEDLLELLRVLERYYTPEMVRRARDSYEETRDLFVLEAVLDRQYFSQLQRRVGKLDRAQRQYVQPMTDRLLDQINLVWLLRYRFAYGFEPPHAYFLLGPGGEHMDAHTVLELVRLESTGEVLEKLPPAMRLRLGEVTSTSDIETRLEQDRLQVARTTLRYTRFNLGRALAYLMLREFQLGRIHIAVRGEYLRLAPAFVARAAGLAPGPTDVQARGG